MSEFSSRMETQRQILRLVNERIGSNEKLFALNSKAIQRWRAANNIEASAHIVQLLVAASNRLFVMSNHSDDPIAGTHQLMRESVKAIQDQIRAMLVNEPLTV
jgi:hypothetical protein